MKLKWDWSLEKQKHLLAKLAVSILLVGLAFRLLFSQSTGKYRPHSQKRHSDFINPKQPVSIDLQENRGQIPDNGSQVSENPNPAVDFPDNGTKVSLDPKSAASVDFPENPDQIPGKEKCDLFTGDWIPSSSGPLYTNESCRLIEGHQNCMTNGRPDTGYLYWRWNPRYCELPPFNAGQFLELMRNKTWSLIGDSITRNHVQSLLCILSKVEPAVEVYHDEEYRSKKWLFPLYNFTVSVIWSPFLAKAAIFEDYNGVSTSEVELHLDKLDQTWTDLYRASDYMIFSSGKWFVKSTIYYENGTILGCHNCPKRNLTAIGFNFAYRKVLQGVFNFIISSNHTGTIFYRASTPDHFENGEWFNGGSCQRTVPAKEGEFEMNELNKILRVVELEEFEKAATKASEKGMNLKLLDVMKLSLLRPDGHPGLYRYFHPYSMDNSTKIFYDCLHWCLPGPIDSWNDLLMEMVVNG
ncbi:protein trichome birefringence-like 23 [Actinidia eriantha]|uniref:protein trichome birefringence-like 23 n=1 Tax=Actinidia eriantha TaxID=165200 RepID=UPI00258337BA|nr:protein trichome birefringence-like 23 [Actinidia eriantha]